LRLDRLGRSLRELLEVVDMLKERRIHFQSLFGAIAHFERRLIGERTKDGLAAANMRPYLIEDVGRQPELADQVELGQLGLQAVDARPARIGGDEASRNFFTIPEMLLVTADQVIE